jgi:hypothetical protein
MSDINVISQIEDIEVAPAKQLINVFNMPHAPVIISQPIGVPLLGSYPASWNSGMLTGGGDQYLWDFRLPTNMKVGDHIRLTHWGSIGDNSAGAAPWYYRVWLDGISTGTDLYLYPTPNAGTGGKRCAYMVEIDIMMQSTSSVLVMQKACMGNYVVPGTSQTAPAEGLFHTLLSQKSTTQNLPGLGCRITAQCGGGTAPGSSITVRGLIVEHLVAP